MFKLLLPLLAKNSCKENVNFNTACCIKNALISPSATNSVSVRNLTQRRHFLFSSTNRKTTAAFPANPEQQLGVSNRLGQQLELLPALQINNIFLRQFHRSSVVLLVESPTSSSGYKEAVDTNKPSKEKHNLDDSSINTKRDSYSHAFRENNSSKQRTQSIFEEDEDNIFGTM